MTDFDTYTSLAFKALLNKETEKAKKLLLISQLSKKGIINNFFSYIIRLLTYFAF